MTRRPRPAETLGEFPPITGESVRSKNYVAGRAVRYAGRIHGPTFPVVTYSVDDLPDSSIFKPMVQAAKAIANDPMNDLSLDELRTARADGAMAAWFAASGISHKGSGPVRDDLYTTLHADTHLGHGKSDG